MFTIFSILLNSIQPIVLERPRLVSDHFYLATSITLPNRNEAEDSGHLKYGLFSTHLNRLDETIRMSTNNIGFC